MNVPRLRGLIAEKFKTVEAMSKHLNWQRDKLQRILRGERKTSTDDVLDMAEALDLLDRPDDIVSIFIK